MGALDDMMLEEAGNLLAPPAQTAHSTPNTRPAIRVRLGRWPLARSGMQTGEEAHVAATAGLDTAVAQGALQADAQDGAWTLSRRLCAGEGAFRLELLWPADGRDQAALPERVATVLRASAPIEDALAAYLAPEVTPPPEGWAQDPAATRTILDHARCLSERLSLIMLVDPEGLVHSLAGSASGAEDLAVAAAQLRRRAEQAFSGWKLMTTHRLWMSYEGSSTLVADLPRTGLSLVVKASGSGVARGLAETAFLMLSRIVCGQAAPSPAEEGSLRRRYAWFQAPVLRPRSPCVSRRDSGVFHAPHCRRLAATPEHRLEWYPNRAEALRASLRPCHTCRP